MNNIVGVQADYQTGSALQQNNIDGIDSAYNLAQMGEMGDCFSPQADENEIFEVTRTDLHLLKPRGLCIGIE